MEACEETGLIDVIATGVLPFPRMRLPAPLKSGYVRLTRKLGPLSMTFNRSRARWTAKWGLMLALYGVKMSR